jgi:hypothetical protein
MKTIAAARIEASLELIHALDRRSTVSELTALLTTV